MHYVILNCTVSPGTNLAPLAGLLVASIVTPSGAAKELHTEQCMMQNY